MDDFYSGSQTNNPLWWLASKTDKPAAIFAIVNRLRQDQQDRMDRNMRSLRLYGNMEMAGLAPYAYSRAVTPQLPENRVKVNIISSMCDTVTSKIGKLRPKVSFLTSGGNMTSQRQAQNLTKFMLGAFYLSDIHRKHQQGFLDSTIFDVGALKHYIAGNKIVSERVLATELLVDPVDALYGNPRCLYQYKFIHKDVLKARYPKLSAAIEMAAQESGSVGSTGAAGMDTSGYVTVVEAWHLPSSEDAGDGRHTICISKQCLVDEEYKRDYFPFTFFKWASRLVGFWGQSLAERLTGNQLEINKMLRIIQKAFHLGSAFKVFLEYGSKVPKEMINNDIGSIIYYSGQKPEFYVPQTVHSEYFNHLNFLIQSSYEEAGISQLSASAQKPAGLESGKALREYNDIETERFAMTSQEYENSFLETARQYIDLAKEMKERGIDLEVVAQSKRFIERIKWSEVQLEKDAYIMQMFPTSFLPHTPAGRLQYVQELVNGGYVSQEYALKLLDFPDLESYADLVNAPIDDILATIEDIVETGNYQPPEPLQDLALGLKMFQSAYLKCKRDGVSEERLDMLRTWMATAQAMLPAPPPTLAPGSEGVPPPPAPTADAALPPPA